MMQTLFTSFRPRCWSASEPGTIGIGIERTGHVILSTFIGGGWPCGH